MSEKNQDFEKRSKFLAVALTVSVTFNVALLVNFAFLAFKQDPPSLAIGSEKEVNSFKESLESRIDSMFGKSMKELLDLLKDESPIEEGYKTRDLALACLSNFHYLNIEKALSGTILQKRYVRFEKKGSGESFEFVLYPGLKEEHFQAVYAFVQSEKWPFTPEGVFFELKKGGVKTDASLKEAFYKTEHFQLIELLFKRNQLTVTKELLLKMILLNDFESLDKFNSRLLQSRQFPKDLLFNWLKSCIQLGSSTAATLIVELDPNYVLKSFEDVELSRIIKNLKIKSDRTLYFLRELITSIRADPIRKDAATKLYGLYADSMPQEINHLKFMQDIAQNNTLSQISIFPHSKEYIIKEGDTLWQIARKNKVSVEKLIEKNHIDKNKPLQIGKVLQIP